jgi:hypothetical protein
MPMPAMRRNSGNLIARSGEDSGFKTISGGDDSTSYSMQEYVLHEPFGLSSEYP